MPSLADLSLAEISTLFQAWGFPAVHGPRVLRNFYAHGGTVAWEKLILPRGLRERIEAELGGRALEEVTRQQSEDGTVKLLLRAPDGRTVEAVLMPDFRDDRAAGCVSSQVGCAMGCDFCATAQGGFARNLTAGEIVAQFLALRREAQTAGRRLQTLVFMGMGEPMLNLEHVLEAVRRIAGNDLGGLGWSQVTVSTVGVVPGISALTDSGLAVNLAVSLHAPSDELRAQLLPMGRRFTIADILAAADRHQATTGRVTTIQYCLLTGVNDTAAHAAELAAVLAGRRMHVNLLRYNFTGTGLSGATYTPPTDEAIEAFLAELRVRGVVTHFRRARGPEIAAACGQLRRRHDKAGK